MCEPILRCIGLTKRYACLTALDNLTFELPKGKIIGLLGPNDSGKTTLLQLLAGLSAPTAGRILLNGQTPGTQTKTFVSYMPQRLSFDRAMTVEQCVALFYDFYADFDRAQAEKMLYTRNIPPKAKLSTLSASNQKNVQLVLSMARKARLYLLDEPLGGVDPAARDSVLNTILPFRTPEATILIATHQIQEAEPILDEFMFLHNGHIYAHDTVASVREQKGMSLNQFFREVFRCFPNY